MTHPTTAGYSLKSMMWGTDGTERRGCGERCSEVFQHGNKDFDCLIMNNSSLLVAGYDKETVLGPVQKCLRANGGQEKQQADMQLLLHP